jgi:hypothetical protein
MKSFLTLFLLFASATQAATAYRPSDEAIETRDRPRMKQEQITLPEQRPSEAVREEEMTSDGRAPATKRHDEVKGKSGQLVPYGIK